MFGTNARDHILFAVTLDAHICRLIMKHLSLFQDSLKVDFRAIFSLFSSYLSTVFSLQRLCAPLNLSRRLFSFLQGFAQRVSHAKGFSQIYNSARLIMTTLLLKVIKLVTDCDDNLVSLKKIFSDNLTEENVDLARIF